MPRGLTLIEVESHWHGFVTKAVQRNRYLDGRMLLLCRGLRKIDNDQLRSRLPDKLRGSAGS